MKAFVAFLAAIVLCLAACTPEPSAPIRLAVNPWLGYAPFVLAQETGQTDRQRLRVVELSSNSESQRALANGLAEAAALTLDEALRLADAGVPLRLLAVLDVSLGADALVVNPEITQLGQLAGRRIGVENGAVGAFMLNQVLAAAGLTKNDVEIVSVEASQHVGALTGKRVDAVITFEPMRSLLLRQGYRVLFDSHTLPDAIYDVLVVRDDIADSELLLAAWEKGLKALQQEDPAILAQLARGSNLSAHEYRQALRGLRFFSPTESKALLQSHNGKPPAFVAQTQAIVDSLLATGLLRQPPDWLRLLGRGGSP